MNNITLTLTREQAIGLIAFLKASAEIREGALREAQAMENILSASTIAHKIAKIKTEAISENNEVIDQIQEMLNKELRKK